MSETNKLFDLLLNLDQFQESEKIEILALAKLQVMVDPTFKTKLRELLTNPLLSEMDKLLIQTAVLDEKI